MSFEAVWGFDPDRAIQAQGVPPSEIETVKFTYSAGSSELRGYRPMWIRRFMSSAECIDCDAVVENFRTLAHRCIPLSGHFDRWPPLLIRSPKQNPDSSSGFKSQMSQVAAMHEEH